MRVVLIGPPGCGKGTQAGKISKKYSLPHVSTGEIFREIAKKNTAEGKKIKKIIESGKLVPDKITISLLKKRLAKGGKKGFVIDGFPRTLGQAKTLSKMKIDHVLYLDVPEEILVKRLLLRKRKDDTLSTIRERIKVYRKTAKPLLEFYKKAKLLRKINGNQDIEGVFSDVMKALG